MLLLLQQLLLLRFTWPHLHETPLHKRMPAHSTRWSQQAVAQQLVKGGSCNGSALVVAHGSHAADFDGAEEEADEEITRHTSHVTRHTSHVTRRGSCPKEDT